MKKSLILLVLVSFVITSCSTEDVLENESATYLNKEMLEKNTKSRPPLLGPGVECTFGYTVDLSNYYYSSIDNSPLVEFTWDFSNALIACNLNAYIEISDTVNGGCGYGFLNESYPINIYSTTPLIKNINQLTLGPPYLVYNPYNPPSYTNEIYGSKCFWWRLRIQGTSCADPSIECETTTEWVYFEWNI